MSDIAEATGLSRQTLYTRFESKEGLIQALISYSTDQIIDAVKNSLGRL